MGIHSGERAWLGLSNQRGSGEEAPPVGRGEEKKAQRWGEGMWVRKVLRRRCKSAAGEGDRPRPIICSAASTPCTHTFTHMLHTHIACTHMHTLHTDTEIHRHIHTHTHCLGLLSQTCPIHAPYLPLSVAQLADEAGSLSRGSRSSRTTSGHSPEGLFCASPWGGQMGYQSPCPRRGW